MESPYIDRSASTDRLCHGGDDGFSSWTEQTTLTISGSPERPSSDGTGSEPGTIPPIPELVSIERVGVDRFRGVSPLGWPGERIFGGLVAAQAVTAAGSTMEGARPHSLHAYFLRPGRSELPLDYNVTRVRDGRSFATRSVEVAQSGEVIFTMIASFHRTEPGEEYQVNRAADVALPDGDDPADTPSYLRALSDLDARSVGATPQETDGTFRSTHRTWLRVRDRLPNDPLLHAAIVTLMSDMGTVTAARPPLESTRDNQWVMGASLDHAIWFHRDLRADDWLLYDLHSISLGGARGLARGVLHAADGTLGASVVQEALIRTRPPSS